MPLTDLSRRAEPHELPELMDQPCSYEELRGCLRDIAWVNRLTFAYRPTLSWLADLVERLPRLDDSLRIVDVGCGYGDSLRRIAAWAKRRGVAVSLTGIDLNPDAIRAAKAATPASSPIRFVQGDAFAPGPTGEIDVVLSSLLTHHLEAPEIVRFLRWMETTARLGWFINDLHRKPVPLRAFQAMTAVLPFHGFVKHDGAVSIRRSFLAEDWRTLCATAELAPETVSVRTYWPARLCVERVKSLGMRDT